MGNAMSKWLFEKLVTPHKALFLKGKIMHAARGASMCFKVTGTAAKYNTGLVLCKKVILLMTLVFQL